MRELLSFALKLGLRREWLQAAGTPGEHFDLTASMRDRAVRLGAREVPTTVLAGVVAARRPSTTLPPRPTLSGEDGAASPPRRRHKWVRQAVAVPWSPLPGSIRTCRTCGMTRQSVPSEDGRFWRVEYGIQAGDGSRFVYGKTPPCPGFVPSPAAAQPRESTSEGPRGGVGVQDFDAQGRPGAPGALSEGAETGYGSWRGMESSGPPSARPPDLPTPLGNPGRPGPPSPQDYRSSHSRGDDSDQSPSTA
jgi:hypothetical protein